MRWCADNVFLVCELWKREGSRNVLRPYIRSSQGCCPEATPVSNLDPTYHTPPKTKHTCELLAEVQVQLGELHLLERLDVAWGNGVGGGRVRRNAEGSQESSLRDGLRQHPLLI